CACTEKEDHVRLWWINRIYARVLACAGGLLALGLLLMTCAGPLAAPDSSAAVSDILRDQALFLLGGEASNPRLYDPAVGGGNLLVFSGLVALDPQLQVIPDLAE